MVAFSGEVEFSDQDPNASGLVGQKFTENNMNLSLKGRDMRRAFDTEDFQIMIVANKFQTGFDQPKLCAMYVDKKLAGVECVQTLSRLNRIYPGKAESGTFVLDFFNEQQNILDAFVPYFSTATLDNVSDPNLIYDLFEKLRAEGIFLWTEVESFNAAFYQKSKSSAALTHHIKPAVDRWMVRYKAAMANYKSSRDEFARTKKTGDPVLMANAENRFKDTKKGKDRLDFFKKDLGTFTRFYEFMSQIVDYDDTGLEKLSLYARALRPKLRESIDDENDIDFSNVGLTHYRLSKIRQQNLYLSDQGKGESLKVGEGVGTSKAKDKKEEFLSLLVNRLNEIFLTDKLTDKDLVNYAHTVCDKLRENKRVMAQIKNNSPDKAILGDFPKAMDDAIHDSSSAQQNQMLQLLSDSKKSKMFGKLIFEMLKNVS